MKNKTQAFTLLEAMIIVALIGILTAWGLPQFQSVTTNSCLTAGNNNLVTAMQFARSAAIRSRSRVVVCTSADATSPTPTCGPATTPWTSGWIIFKDVNNDAVLNGTDELLRVESEATGCNGNTIELVDLSGAPTNIVNFVSFAPPIGEPLLPDLSNQTGTFKICSTDDSDKIRGVMLHVSGRISSTRDAGIVGSTCP